MKRVIPIKKNRPQWSQDQLSGQLKEWRSHLQEQDRSPGTVEKYGEAVQRFLSWYEQEEGGGAPLQLEALTPIALIGYRNRKRQNSERAIFPVMLGVVQP